MILSALMAAALAHAWTEYAYRDTGVAISFPAPPSEGQSAYPAGERPVPATVYSLQLGAEEFSLAVADFAGRPREQARAVRDALAMLTDGGEVKENLPACVDGRSGRSLTLAGKDGSRARVSVFSMGKQIYFLEARIPPGAGDPAEAVRFQQSLRFTGPAPQPACRPSAR